MSRYFTSPPPVYARNWANGQNLVESTKIERQIVTSKKVHRKEKKEKKKDKKEKSHKKQYIPIKKVSNESEQLEKSCLTEEYVGYLSDGSQNSKKRRREASPAVESSIKATHVPGNPLRIRFVFKKPKEAEVVPQEDRICSTSRSECPCEKLSPVSVLKTFDRNENLLSTSNNDIPSESKKRKKHKISKESRYNALFNEWAPPATSFAGFEGNKDDSDDNWLFSSIRKQNATTTTKAADEFMNMNRAGESSLLPKAQFLSDVGIFSLPYTVLF